MLHQRLRLFAAAAEDERISTLEAEYPATLAGQFDEPERDVALQWRWLATALSGEDTLGTRARPIEDRRLDERIVDDHVGLPERIQRVQRQQARVAGPGAAEPYPAGQQLGPVMGGQGRRVAHASLMARCGRGGKRGRDVSQAIGGGQGRAYDPPDMGRKPTGDLRRGWTTGACATAAVKAALMRFWGGGFPDEVQIVLPKGERPVFPLALAEAGEGWAEAGIVKDAGDDPDVTHGALIVARVAASPGGVVFRAGDGVGTVTKPGLPIAPGEPAINPVPREMMRAVVEKCAATYGKDANIEIKIRVPGGVDLARKTWNPRLGIEGGISILGTTGIVRPFSCAAWIASIQRGIDVARATGLDHVAGCTGSTSERAVQALHGLPDHAMLDMGDFAGGMLKYLRRHPVPRLSVGGGIGKMSKLAQGATDLHSARSQVDFGALADLAGAPAVADAGTALEALEIAGPELAERVAASAKSVVESQLQNSGIAIDIVVVDRGGQIVGRAP